MGTLTDMIGRMAQPMSMAPTARFQGGVPGGMIPGDFSPDQQLLPSLPPHQRVASMLSRIGNLLDQPQGQYGADNAPPLPSFARHAQHLRAIANQSQEMLDQAAHQPGGLPQFKAETPWGGGFGGFQMGG